jgi:D-hydroxyproline dehydrogenase subunit gamma
MPDAIAGFPMTVNGKTFRVKPGMTVAAAMLAAGQYVFRRSVSDQPRGPLCGMGICLECRVTINGVAHQKSCQILCQDGMVVASE